NYRLGPSKDYIQQEALRGYELNEISSQLNNPIQDSWAVYIGRSDCGECQNFEASIILSLDKNGYVLPAY
ncbi:MAG: hypothetical protein IJV62_01450, partial [Eggerthellaceae bacterium]|nr:hypothetical protein [Eggerthellaceae bacterium]